MIDDEGINLNFLFPTLDPGASVQFTWVYILRTSDLLTAMNQINTVNMLSPTTTVSGSEVAFSARVMGFGSRKWGMVAHGLVGTGGGDTRPPRTFARIAVGACVRWSIFTKS